MKDFKKAVERVLDLLPEWAKDRNIILLADQELVFRYDSKRGLKLKVNRCNHCGECCLDVVNGHLPFGVDDEGRCNVLIKEGDKWLCSAGHQRPYACLDDPQEGDELDCSIKYL